MFDFSIKVAHKVIRFKSENPKLTYDASGEREFVKFICNEDADMTLEVRYEEMPDFSGKETLFHVDGSWTLSRYEDKVLFEYPDRSLVGRTERVGEINKDMTCGTVYVNREKTPEEEEESKRQRESQMTEEDRRKREERMAKKNDRKKSRSEKPDVTTGTLTVEKPEEKAPPKKQKTPEELGKKVMSEVKANFFQAFLVEYLIRKNVGFLVHCSSVYCDGKLYLFMGQSNAGKSTIADFWHTRAKATVFNDDRAVLTVEGGVPRFYNAPWVGTLVDKCELEKGNGTEIDKIFFLRQSKKNVLRKLGRVEAAAKIFKNSFPVFWERSALSYVLNKCSEMTASAACYDLDFVNNDSVVEFLQKELNKKEA